MKQLVASILLVPSLALAQPGASLPPPAPLPQLAPTSPLVAMPAGGYAMLPAQPESPSRGRHIAGGVTLAAGLGIAILGGWLISSRPAVPPLGSPGWFDAQGSSDIRTVGGVMLISTGAITALVGALLVVAPDQPYGEFPGAPALTF